MNKEYEKENDFNNRVEENNKSDDPKEVYYNEVYLRLFDILEKEFLKRGFKLDNNFDYNIWFLNKNSNSSSINNFKEILSSTPSETDDIIRHIIVKSYIREKSSHFKINTESFICELVEILIYLHKEIKRINKLIKKYNAYETVNILDQTLANFDNISFPHEYTKSKMTFFIRNTENFPRADYQISLLTGFYNYNSKIDILEHKLNNVLRIQSDFSSIKYIDFEYHFKPVEFYSFENNQKSVNDSGTNFSYFFIKLENLNRNNNDTNFSQQVRILEVILSNMKIILNNYKKNKILETSVEIENEDEDLLVSIDLGIKIELDPMTCSSIFSKVKLLLKELISYKVQTLHKWKTIMNYFEDVSEKFLHSFILNIDTKIKGGRTKKEIFKDFSIFKLEEVVFKDSEDERDFAKEEENKEKEDKCVVY